VETQHLCPASPSRGGLPGLAGVTTRPAGYPRGGVPPAVRDSSTYVTARPAGYPSGGVPPAVRDSSTYVTTRPAGYPSGGVPPAVESQLHLHHTPSRVPQRRGATSCREAAPLTPHAQPGTPAAGCHQLSRGSSTYTTRPAGYPSGGVPSAVERQLHLLTVFSHSCVSLVSHVRLY
jgi:hypothetical protein